MHAAGCSTGCLQPTLHLGKARRSWSTSPSWKSCWKQTAGSGRHLRMKLAHGLPKECDQATTNGIPEKDQLSTLEKMDVEWYTLVAVVGLMSCFQFLDASAGAAAAADSLVSGGEVVHPQQLFSIAEGEDFWSNMASYGRFFVSVMAGTGYVMIKPVLALLKRPRTAILVVIGATLVYFGLRATIESMLGLTEYDYTPSSFVT